jgi:hypothetical protein
MCGVRHFILRYEDWADFEIRLYVNVPGLKRPGIPVTDWSLLQIGIKNLEIIANIKQRTAIIKEETSCNRRRTKTVISSSCITHYERAPLISIMGSGGRCEHVKTRYIYYFYE